MPGEKSRHKEEIEAREGKRVLKWPEHVGR